MVRAVRHCGRVAVNSDTPRILEAAVWVAVLKIALAPRFTSLQVIIDARLKAKIERYNPVIEDG